MIEELLPDDVAVVEALSDPVEAVLFPAEEALLAQAVEKRRLEFTTVRHCARVALGRLGVPAVPILPGEHGAPQWPKGIVGSMTHCVGYRGAVVARSTDVVTVGVDAEPHEALPPEVLATVTLPEERGQLARLAATRPGVHWDRLLFSAKEAVYKSWYPLTRRWLDFDEANISFDVDARSGGGGASGGGGDSGGGGGGGVAESGTFYARLLVPGPVVDGVQLPGFTGRWLVRDGLLFTAIALPTDRIARPAASGAESATVTAIRLP